MAANDRRMTKSPRGDTPMRSHNKRSSQPAGRSLALATILAALLALLPGMPAGAAEAPKASVQPAAAPVASDGGTCPADGSGETPKSGAVRDTLKATHPGLWRRDGKFAPPRERIPGTQTVAPRERLSTDAVTAGRWVRGYRPATAEAQSEFEAWQEAQAATLGTASSARGSEPAERQLRREPDPWQASRVCTGRADHPHPARGEVPGLLRRSPPDHAEREARVEDRRRSGPRL